MTHPVADPRVPSYNNCGFTTATTQLAIYQFLQLYRNLIQGVHVPVCAI